MKNKRPKAMFSLAGGTDADPLVREWRALQTKHPKMPFTTRLVLLATRLPPYKGLTAAQLRHVQGMPDRLVDLRRHLNEKGAISDADNFEADEETRRHMVRPFVREMREGIFDQATDLASPAAFKAAMDKARQGVGRAWAIVTREWGRAPLREGMALARHLLASAAVDPDGGDIDAETYSVLAEGMEGAVCGWLDENRSQLSPAQVEYLEAARLVRPAG
jgi:hypothetical protein